MEDKQLNYFLCLAKPARQLFIDFYLFDVFASAVCETSVVLGFQSIHKHTEIKLDMQAPTLSRRLWILQTFLLIISPEVSVHWL